MNMSVYGKSDGTQTCIAPAGKSWLRTVKIPEIPEIRAKISVVNAHHGVARLALSENYCCLSQFCFTVGE